MLNYLKNENNLSYTENGAVTNVSTLSDCLDLFATIGAMRFSNDEAIINSFIGAYTENPDIAMKTLFYARDVREGLGERRAFRVIISWLAQNKPDSLLKNLNYISEYGRFDDLLTLLKTPCEEQVLKLIQKQLNEDLHSDSSVSLLAKWLPSVNASNAVTVKQGKYLAKKIGMTEKEYRQTLSKLRKKIKLIENNLREKNYSFDYSKQPSKAMFKYRNAFIRNDGDRYNAFLDSVAKGEAKLNTGALYPYEVVRNALRTVNFAYCRLSEDEKASLNTTWDSFDDFCDNDNSLAVVDTSGSMYSYNRLPVSVAFSLGLYFAEHNKGAFRNHFITFSSSPQLLEIKGDTFCDKLKYLSTLFEIGNTNIEAVFDLILNTAVKNSLSQEQLPEKLYIISDMEFDICAENASLTNFENAKKKFEKQGYKLPKIIFWNVASHGNNQPVTKNEQGVALVSGCTPKLFSYVASGNFSPYEFMLEIINSPRYEPI